MSTNKRYTIKESYRNKAYVGVVNLDARTNSWAWKGHVDFNEGLHSMFTNRTFTTALQAEDHMRQFAHQCIDNRLDATRPHGFQFPDLDFPKLRIEKTFFAPHAVVLLGHRLGRYIAFVPPGNPTSGLPVGVFDDALIRQELLSNIEQS